jgi:hypothetical protein
MPAGFLKNAQICMPPDGGSGAMGGDDDASPSETSTSNDASTDDASGLDDSPPNEGGNDGDSDAMNVGAKGPTHD